MLSILRRRVHISWLIAILSGCFVVGVWLASFVILGRVQAWSLLIVGLIFVATAFITRKTYLIILVIIGGVLIGLWRGSLMIYDLKLYEPFYETDVVITGIVRDDPVINDSSQWVLEISRAAVGELNLPGSVRVTVSDASYIKRSDRVSVGGQLIPGFGTYPAVIYRASVKSIARSPTSDPGGRARDWFSNAVKQVVAEPQASLGTGYLTGQKSALPKDLSEDLRIVGLTHIVVASGYNLTILVRLSRRLFMRISKYVAAFASFLMVAAFMTVTGLSPSMSRAGLVAGLSLLAWYYGRRFHPFVLIPFAAGITVAIQPSYTWGDMGWQLSFAAFAGVIVIAPLFQRYFFGDKKPGVLRQVLGETISAHFATLPILIAGFGLISNVAIFANILVVPLVPLAMLLTFLSGIFMLVAPSIAYLIAAPTEWLLTYMVSISQYLAGLPWAQTEISLHWWAVLLIYLVLILICVYMTRATKYDLSKVNIVE